jgi:hypothetical protein
MNRPVAMTSCLHRVLFAPRELKVWVANAAPAETENFAACYQPWYAYDFAALLALIPAQTPDGVKPVPAPPARPAAGP